MTPPEIKEIRPPEAWELLNSNAASILIDCRSTMEFNYVGHPVQALHVPWSEPPGWQVNMNFAEAVRELLEEQPLVDGAMQEERPILVICRSGVRSLDAGKVLAANGFRNVYNVMEGFEGPLDEERHRSNIGGWRYHGLPWVQS